MIAFSPGLAQGCFELLGIAMNFDRLRFVAERAEVGEEREALFAVTIPEERRLPAQCACRGSRQCAPVAPPSFDRALVRQQRTGTGPGRSGMDRSHDELGRLQQTV